MAQQDNDFPSRNVEVQAAQRMYRHFAGSVGLGERAR